MGTGYIVPAPPFVGPDADVVEYDGDATLDVGDFGVNLTNTGATATVKLTLPAAADVGGLSTRVYLTTDNIVQFAPASGESIYLGGSGTADEILNIAAVVGNFAELYSDGEKYHVLRYSGVLTKTT